MLCKWEGGLGGGGPAGTGGGSSCRTSSLRLSPPLFLRVASSRSTVCAMENVHVRAWSNGSYSLTSCRRFFARAASFTCSLPDLTLRFVPAVDLQDEFSRLCDAPDALLRRVHFLLVGCPMCGFSRAWLHDARLQRWPIYATGAIMGTTCAAPEEDLHVVLAASKPWTAARLALGTPRMASAVWFR